MAMIRNTGAGIHTAQCHNPQSLSERAPERGNSLGAFPEPSERASSTLFRRSSYSLRDVERRPVQEAPTHITEFLGRCR